LDNLIGSLLELAFIWIGKLVVPVLTLGRWRGEKLGSNEYSIHGAAGALSFVVDGQRVISRHGLLFLGIATTVVVIIVALVITSSHPSIP
jgi:hypothetical protein